jgi:hypothetical protein
MPTEKKKDIIQLRSPEVQELIGHIPNGFMRYGIGLILSLLIAILITCNFIPYKEVKSFSLRVLPSVPAVYVRSPFDGQITHCYVKDGLIVSSGDTLLTILVDGKLHILKATTCGKVRLCSFCIPNEPVMKGQKLMEVCEHTSTIGLLTAIADTLPQSIYHLKKQQSIDIDLNGESIPFKLVSVIEDKESSKKQALFQSENRMELTRQQRVEGKIVMNDGVLLDKLIQIKW